MTEPMEPASIRTKNPGAMWGSALAKKWGSTETIQLHDGLGQSNNIAVFPTYVQGICAQLDLWRTSPNYRNKRFADAIAVWSGHNGVESYIQYVLASVPGMARDTVMDDAFWRGPMGIPFLKAQAAHEAGRFYPAPNADWIEAHRRVFDGKMPPIVILSPIPHPLPPDVPRSIPAKSKPKLSKKSAGAIFTGGAAAGAAAHHSGISIGWVIVIGIVVAAVTSLIWKFQEIVPRMVSIGTAIAAILSAIFSIFKRK